MRLVKRKLMQSKEVLENVPHNFKYHAEIKYETENGFGYTNAMGNSINELMEGISERLEYYKNREPYLQEVLYDPNGEKADVTYKIRNLLEGIKDAI